MLKVHTHPAYAIRDVEPNNKPLAIHTVGDGHSGTSTCRGYSEEIPTCCHGLFQKMGRGGSIC